MELVFLFFSHMHTIFGFLGIGQHVNLGRVPQERHAIVYLRFFVYLVSCHVIQGFAGNVAVVPTRLKVVGQGSGVELSCRL